MPKRSPGVSANDASNGVQPGARAGCYTAGIAGVGAEVGRRGSMPYQRDTGKEMKEQPFRVAAASQRARNAAQPGFPADRVPIGGWPFLPVGAAFALAWVVFSWPWLSGAVTIPWDAKAHFQPQVQFLAASLARGDSPFW